jgi:hypothetical protein
MTVSSEMKWKTCIGPHVRLLLPDHRATVQEVLTLQRASENPGCALFYCA